MNAKDERFMSYKNYSEVVQVATNIRMLQAYHCINVIKKSKIYYNL